MVSTDETDGWRKRMKIFYDETMETFDKKPCEGSRQDLRECLLLSDCHLIHKKPIKECLKVHDGTVSDSCLAIRTSFFECKRSILDNRQRFRGRKGY